MTDTSDTRSTRAMNLVERFGDRLDDLRTHIDKRFDRLEVTQEKSDQRVDSLSEELYKIKMEVAIMKDRWKWIGALAGLGGAGATQVAHEVIQRAGPLVGQ